MFDLTDVGYVKRITIGSVDPGKLATEDENNAAAEMLNRCLSEQPRGKIIGMEKNFAVLNVGEHQVVLQALTYNVGFTRRPYWLTD